MHLLTTQESCDLKRQFTHAAHKSVVKSLAAAGPFLASGGADDLIHVYDLLHDKDLGFLMNPGEGAITALEFFTPQDSFSPTHLLAGCSDGSLTIWKAGQGWQCMKTLRGHRHEITSIAIHETGLLALTTSRDKTIRLWDLVKGRTTFHSKLEREAEQVLFSPSGTKYALRAGNKISVIPVNSQSGEGTVVLEHDRKVTCVCFGTIDEAVVTGTEDGILRAWRIVSPAIAADSRDEPGSAKIVLQLDAAHNSRIKALAIPKTYIFKTFDDNTKAKEEEDDDDDDDLPDFPSFVATASSDGTICLWRFSDAVHHSESSSSPIQPASGYCIATAETRARLTVMCATDSPTIMEIRSKELASIAKAQKNTQKKHKKKDGHRSAPRQQAIQATGEKPKQAKALNQKAQQPVRATAITTTIDGTNVVSFVDEKDTMREAKKKKKIQIHAKRQSTIRQEKAKKKKKRSTS
jgi:WD40 repeat protein